VEVTLSFKRILVAMDGGAISLQAARTAMELARALNAEIAIVHAVEPPIEYSGEIGFPAEMLLQASAQETAEIFDALKRSVDLPDSASHFLHVGHAAEVIASVVGEWRADLVVIGSHGRGGLGRVLLGSVAEAVVRHAPCPVLVTRRVG
jgi:nucleotide-binding universal stress UspA family protein